MGKAAENERVSDDVTVVEIPWAQQPRQMQFLAACGLDHPFNPRREGRPTRPVADVILYGGAAGGGKTDALLIAGAVAALTFPGCNVGFFRRLYTQLEGSGGAIPRSHALFSKSAEYNGSRRRWTFPNGSTIEFCHCAKETDVHNYQSQQFDILLIDEVTQFTRFQQRYLLTRNRATIEGLVPFAAYATNPGGISHGVIKREFIDPGPPGIPVSVEVEEGFFETHLFIPALLEDNLTLVERDPGYRSRLERQPEEVRRALLYGDWSILSGQYFSTFRRDTHVWKPFDIPKDWQRFISLDWGFAAPCGTLWHAVDPSMGRIITYRELYINRLRAKEVAKKIKKITGDEKIRIMVASPDMWQERGLGGGRRVMGGETIAEDFTKEGLPIMPADNRRVMGWTRIREYLSESPDGMPWWICFNTCINLIRTLEDLVHDKVNVEDVDPNCEDHLPEALRYGLMTRPQPQLGPGVLIPGSGKGSLSRGGNFDNEAYRDEIEDLMDSIDLPSFY